MRGRACLLIDKNGAPRYFAYYTEEEMGSLFRNGGFEELASDRYPEEVFGDIILQMWFRLKEL